MAELLDGVGEPFKRGLYNLNIEIPTTGTVDLLKTTNVVTDLALADGSFTASADKVIQLEDCTITANITGTGVVVELNETMIAKG